METAMDDKKPDARTIAEEAVGQIRGAPIPDAAKDQAVTPTVEVVRQLATSAAESVGERIGDAYATTAEVKAGSRKVARTTESQTSRAAQQPFVMVAAGFALGYAAAVLIHRRQ